ncbi:3'-5' exonuclease [Myroides odoratimimus]|uniref:3'-5' exonuclease n=1 Tax=Myroides odoratimimus TaxID=76832 RepID=UPI0029C070B4|nr:3'-5' exonuclease [Myroides odoratimimus]MDX4972145.1 3'-5' exonuclease [Myroides odoratimimus]
MKLFIYDKFWDAFLKINKGTQSKITEFISKFRINSKSSALNLESINTFKDQSLRTARVDDKYRAVLKEVTPGELYLLVWVDNHDEAMAWAKNKVIDWNEQTQAYQVFSLDDTVTIEDSQVPTSEKTLFMGLYTEADLVSIGVPEVLIPSVLKVVDFTGLENLENYLPVDAFENLFYLLDGASIESLKTDILLGKQSEDTLGSKNNARSFIEFTDDEILNEALRGSLHKWKYYLHPSQSAIVNGNFKGAVKISGGAGTGKTVAALHRLKYLAEKKVSELPILFTTFTKELSESLSSLAEDLEIPQRKYKILNIDALAFQLAQEFNLRQPTDKVFGMNAVKGPKEIWEEVLEENLASFDEDFLKQEFEEVILVQNIHTSVEYLKASRVGRGKAISRKQRLEVWKLIEQFQIKKTASHLYYKEEIYNLVSNYLNENNEIFFSHVIVDELQDFSNVELNFIRSLASDGENDLFLVGDPLQNIYDRKINFSKAGINIRGTRSKRLRINYRTTEEIKNLAMSVILDEKYDNFDGEEESKSGYLSLFHGPKPVYTLYLSKEEELQAIKHELISLLEVGVHYNEIAIAARTRNSANDFRNHLHKYGIPFVDKHLLNSTNEGIRISTFHGLKGLEFKHVFLVDVNDRTSPKLPYDYTNLSEIEKSQILRTEKSLFYVAASRAIQQLSISGVGIKSELLR